MPADYAPRDWKLIFVRDYEDGFHLDIYKLPSGNHFVRVIGPERSFFEAQKGSAQACLKSADEWVKDVRIVIAMSTLMHDESGLR